MINTDNVGGLPELQRYSAVFDNDDPKRELLFLAKSHNGPWVKYDDAIAYAELCRAAPAGGDVPFDTVRSVCRALTRLGHTTPDSQEEQAARAVELVDTLCREVQSHFDSLGSAPVECDLDERALQVARRFTRDGDPQTRAIVQTAVASVLQDSAPAGSGEVERLKTIIDHYERGLISTPYTRAIVDQVRAREMSYYLEVIRLNRVVARQSAKIKSQRALLRKLSKGESNG